MKRIIISISFIFIFIISTTFSSVYAAANPTAESYIIVFKDSVNPTDAAHGLAKAYGLQTGFIYEHALKGMSALVPEGRLTALQHDPRVKYVEKDTEVHLEAQTVPTGIERIFADGNPNIAINSTDDFRVDVDVAVIDTGIDFQHPELNVMGGINCTLGNLFSAVCADGGDDDHYHGTHVAGTIGAFDNGSGVVGVAPGARLWAVKVLNKRGSGYTSWIVAGIDWVTAHADTIEVANMSLGGSGFNQAEYDAIQGAVNAGVAFAVAAGNENDDANNYSPGGFDNVLSVSALADFNGLPGGGAPYTCRTDVDDTLADFSNWGPQVDIAAPGVCILSTYPLEKGEYGTISGTSMASPHVAGALALLASRNNPNNATDVYALYNTIKTTGNSNWIDDSGDGIKEPLLDVSNTSIFNPVLVPGSGGSTNQAPTAAFTFTTSDLTANFTDTSTDLDGTIVAWSWNFGDGTTSTLQNPSHTYTIAGTYAVSLEVTDNGYTTNSTSQNVTVTSNLPNQAPTADFTYTTNGLTVSLTDTSSDSDGTIVAWGWNFGDGTTSTAQNPSHTYAADGTYTVSLVVTDNDSATSNTATMNVTVTTPVSQSVTVASLTGSSSTVNKNFWRATVEVLIDPALSGAVVTGTWSDGKSFSCTTDGSGICSGSLNLRTSIASITLTINNVSLSGYDYVSGVIGVTVNKP